MTSHEKKTLSERDICTKFISPALRQAGWDELTQVREEVSFTKGRVLIRGRISLRGEPRRADYILSHKPGLPLLVLEAKDNHHSVGAGMQQALDYADTLDVPFSASIKSIQDIMRKDVGVDGDAQRISQLVWLLFLKIFDAQEEELECTRDDYRSPLPQRLRWRNWAADAEGITGDELQKFVNDDLFPALKELQPKTPRHALLRAAFEDAYNYMKSGTLLRQVINKLNEGINFNSSQDRHLFGDIYEQLLRDLQSAGNAGEYYTPRAVTQFMVERTNPRLGELIFDPACGTGGFLTCALEHIRKREVKSPADEQRLQESIRGVEKKPLPHLLCVTNMLLHGIEVPVNIRHDNTLARPYASVTSADRVDVILTNWPSSSICSATAGAAPWCCRMAPCSAKA